MKKLTRISTVLMLLVAITLQISGQTLKERIDEAKQVKVYFSNSDIKHNPHTNPPTGTQQKGTGCQAFTETTPIPADYIEAEKQVIDLLNKGFGTTAFIAGDMAAVPLFPSGVQKGNPDWLKLGEPLVVLITTTGSYITDIEGLGTMVTLVNSLSIESFLGFFGVVDGKIKVLGTKNLVNKMTPTIKTKICDDYAYFVKNFPLSSLLDDFKNGIASKTADFTTKEMASYEKAMNKKK